MGKASQNVMQVNGMDSSSPEESIDAGTRMLADLYRQTGGDVQKTLAAYNMGPGILDYMNQHPEMDARQAMQSFSDYMKQKNGYRIYGDPSYIDHVLGRTQQS